jgi:hypothetical protein
LTTSREYDAKSRLDRHLRRVGAEEYYQNSATFHAEYTLLKTLFTLFEMSMEDEGLSAEIIDRVLDRLLYSSISPSQMQQMETTRVQMEEMAKQFRETVSHGVVLPPLVVGQTWEEYSQRPKDPTGPIEPR